MTMATIRASVARERLISELADANARAAAYFTTPKAKRFIRKSGFRLKPEDLCLRLSSAKRRKPHDTSNRSAQLVGTNRQPIDALAGRGCHGIDQRTSGERRARFANTTRFLRARDDEHVDLWRFVVPHHRVVIEMTLRDPAILDGDLALQCRERKSVVQ